MSATTAQDNLERQKAALYIQNLEDARVFVRWAERAFSDAIVLAPDETAANAAIALRSDAAKLRRMITAQHHGANGRFNPKRTRRVVIETRSNNKGKRKGK